MKNILVIITALFVATVSGHPQGFIYPEDDGAKRVALMVRDAAANQDSRGDA